jgi:F0F1-type ATP synthase membrane subunit c/vacuolar-type H+-ATPase subunit K
MSSEWSLTGSGSAVKRPSLRRIAAAAGLAAAIGCAGPAMAQSMTGQTGQPPMAPQMQQTHFSSKTIHAAGKAIRDIKRINQKYSPEMRTAAQAKDRTKMSEINQKAQHEAIRRLSSDGISPQKYEQVMKVAQKDPALQQRLLKVAGFVPKK